MQQPDAALVLAAQRGSADALGALFDRYWRVAWRAAYAVSGQRELANDAAQDAFLRARQERSIASTRGGRSSRGSSASP